MRADEHEPITADSATATDLTATTDPAAVVDPVVTMEPAALSRAWWAASAARWLREGDWWAPAVDDVAAALTAACGTGAMTLEAFSRLGTARGDAGVGLSEAVEDLCALYTLLPEGAPPLPVVRAFVESWVESWFASLRAVTCVDPLTGLATAAYLRTRLAEVYREGERCGVPVSRSHALVVVTTPGWSRRGGRQSSGGPRRGGRPRRALRRILVGDGVKTAFSGGETFASIADHVVVGLVPRTAGLAGTVQGLRAWLSELAMIPDHTRVWIEGLPEDLPLAYVLLRDLAR